MRSLRTMLRSQLSTFGKQCFQRKLFTNILPAVQYVSDSARSIGNFGSLSKRSLSRACLDGSTKISMNCDAKQQKISNFFNLKTESTNTVRKEQCEDLPNLNIELDTKRSPARKLCENCLQISPKNNSTFCNNCNLSNKTRSFPTLTNSKAKLTNVLEQNTKECEIQGIHAISSSLCESPDVIPPTPPVVIKCLDKKKFGSNKSVKRKFNFIDTDCAKKKLLCPEQRQANKKEQPTNNHVGTNDENTPHAKKKNCQPSTMNPFRKPSNISTNIKNVECSSQTTSGRLLGSALAHPETSVHSQLVNSNLQKKSVVPSEKENPRLDSKSTVEFVDLTNSRNRQEIRISPQKESIPKEKKDSGGKTLEDQSSTTLKNNVFPHFYDKNTLSPRKDSLPELSIPLNKIHSRSDDSQEPFALGKTSDLPPTLLHEEQSQTRHIVCDDKDISSIFLDDLSFDESSFKEPVKLEDGVRCRVLAVTRLDSCGEVVLNVRPCDATSDKESICVLRGSWQETAVSEGDTVSVWARPEGQAGCWAVGNDGGLLVTHPDVLVSGTTVVGALFCGRRSVLSDMYRGMDSGSPVMAIGCFLHELLQEVLKKKLSSIEEIKRVVDEFTSSRHFMFTLYASQMPLDKTRETLNEFIPKMSAFVKKYISSSKSGFSNASGTRDWNHKESWNGTITDVADIEENIWAPRLGIKGKVDVTVKTSARNKHKVMPLELKTGKASFSAEHRGQVILYTMMMSELGQSVDTGLLLYIREGVMQEVQVGSAERRDLVLLRNQLVTQLRASQQVVMSAEDCLQIAAPALPPPINHHSACSKCPYLTICSAALKESGCAELSESNPLQALSVVSTEHLSAEHSAYVFHWTGLLRLEHTESQLRSPAVHDIWTLPPAARRARGTCIASTRLVGGVVEVCSGSYEHRFAWESAAEVTCSFSEGDYVIVSSETRPAVAAGPVRGVASNQLTLHLERDLSVQVKGECVWHLDKYQSQSLLVFNMTNLGCLLDNTEQAERLRKVVVSREIAGFRPKLSSRVLNASVDLLAPLNPQQCRAVFQTLAADHYLLIKGMPGTGKTATIVALVQLAVRLGQSVLITSHTHSAVDNVLLRLRDKVDMLRLGATHKLHPQLTAYADTAHNCSTPQEIHDFYSSKSVVAVTCLGCSHPLLSRRQFDLCLVDEATQVLQPTVLRPLFSARKFVLIGDPNQLPPLVKSSKAKELGLGESLFARLDRPAVTVELSLQYRMNQKITALANALTYSGKLQCASEATANATLSVNPQSLVGQPEWLCSALSSSLHLSVVVLDTGATDATNCTNIREADIVVHILSVLNHVGLSEERSGVIAPYRAQVDLLRKRTQALGSAVEVNTVDQYQGRDKDIIIYSCTRSAKPTESDILGDKNRLTVAVTRARHKLIILGDVTLLRGYPLFAALFASLSASCFVPVPPPPS